jgi:hypothetical protein
VAAWTNSVLPTAPAARRDVLGGAALFILTVRSSLLGSMLAENGWSDRSAHILSLRFGEGTTAAAGTPFSVQLCGS